MKGRRFPPIPGVGALPSPAISSSDERCPFPSRSTRVGTIAALRLCVGLPEDVSSASPPPALNIRRARKRRVRASRLPESDDKEDPTVTAAAGDESAGGAASCADFRAPDDGSAAPCDDGGMCDDPGSPHFPAKSRKTRLGAPRVLVKSRVVHTVAEREERMLVEMRASFRVVVAACLRLSLGMLTRTADFSQPGVCGRLVCAASSPSRAIFCRCGPALVDLAALWPSSTGQVLCSCNGHNQNIALAAVTGGEITCWHADCLRGVLEDVDVEEATRALQVSGGTVPHAITIKINETRCGMAFDGDIFCLVVAVERRQVKCVGVGCRSMERSCTLAKLTRALPELREVGIGDSDGNNDGEDGQTDAESTQPPTKASDDFGEYGQSNTDVAEMWACMVGRRQRNLLPCVEEERLGATWMRTADLMGLHAVADRSTTSAVPPFVEPPAPLQALHACEMIKDTRVRLVEQRCSVCGAEKLEDEAIKEEPAILYTHHLSARPLMVCLPALSLLHCIMLVTVGGCG